MDFWLERVKRQREAMIELRVKLMQRVGWRPVAENRPPQMKRLRAEMFEQTPEIARRRLAAAD
jgi:hypothetical protein